ncbi:MAG: hypothetical protein A3J28_06175 [Acidobacteria bacterium RIFCSPLOWO2_12_FULL_60_22]|nr:MAG: hypothetical protein A3J28_06175 [Acidobacteria bacterium RIFCSPLOWO2_12_FULL_60_22]
MDFLTSTHAVVEGQETAEYQLIRSLEIENFRCFNKINLPDIRRFTIITGKNGSGKTAVLESLFVAAGNSPEIYLRTGAWRSGTEGRVPLSAALSSLASVFEDFFHQFNVEAGLRISFKDSHGNDREVRVIPETEEVITLPFDSKISESAPSRGIKFFWKTPEGETESKIELTPEGLRIPNPRNAYRMIFLNPQTFQSPKENADRFSSLDKKNQEQPIIRAVSALFPQVLGLSIQVKADSPGLFAHVSGVDRKMPIGLLSAGIHKFLAILLAISASPQGAVLVDEIENGFYYKLLTPMWQQLMKHCHYNKCQLIVTTHSKEFLDSIVPLVKGNENDFCLLRTERENGEARVLSFGGKEFASAIESGFEVR